MNSTNFSKYELNNYQRIYFGLNPVEMGWERIELSDKITVYFDQDRIVKILNYGWGYLEYDTIIDTINRTILLPKTSRGKQQKLTIPRIGKIKGSGVQFSGSFHGGNIHVYDNRRNLFFIKSFAEDGNIKSYEDIDNWIENYITNIPPDYFDWLADQLAQRRLNIKVKPGDIIAFKISPTEYGFARILSDVFSDIKKGGVEAIRLFGFHPRSLIVIPYAFIGTDLTLDLDDLISKPILPSICIFDLDVYRGEMPIVGHRTLTEKEKEIQFPAKKTTSITIPLTRKDLEK
jgi:hypothetical protein